MKLTELMRPDFPFRSIRTDYITPTLTPPVVLKPTKPTQDELKNEQAAKRFFGIVKAVVSLILVLILAGLGFGSIGGWLLILPLLVFVWTPKPVGVTATAYVAWFITHIAGVGVFAVGAVGMAVAAIGQSILFQRTDIAAYLLAALLLVLIVVSAVGTLLAKVIAPKAEIDDEDEGVELTPAQDIAQRLPEVLMDYYAPLSDFRRPTPNRREYLDDATWEAAVAEQNEVVNQERLQVAASYIVSVVDDENEEGAVTATLAVRDTQEAIAKQTAMINGRLNAFGTAVIPNADNVGGGTVVLRIYANAVKTPLVTLSEHPVDAERFFAEHPLVSANATPIGQSTQGAAFGLDTHHTCVVGRTGAGKGSVTQTLILQWLPLVAAGTRRLWLVDPKPSEALPYLDEETTEYATTSVFHRIATEDEDIARLIFEFHDEMIAMKKKGVKRSNTESVEKPGNILLVDEAESLIDNGVWGMKNDQGMTVEKALRNVTRKGRSLNFFLYLFTQSNVGKEIFTLNKNIPVKLIGFVGANEIETTRGLDISSSELHERVARREIIYPLPKSTKNNGMRYAGIFNYLEEGEAQPIRVPYISEEFIEKRVREFGLNAPNPSATYAGGGQLPSAPERVEPKEPAEDDYEDLLSKLS